MCNLNPIGGFMPEFSACTGKVFNHLGRKRTMVLAVDLDMPPRYQMNLSRLPGDFLLICWASFRKACFRSYSLIFSAIRGIAMPDCTAASPHFDSVAKFADSAR
jgi:hypothetical protein